MAGRDRRGQYGVHGNPYGDVSPWIYADPLLGFGYAGYPSYNRYGYPYPPDAANLSDEEILNRVYGAFDDNPVIPESADINVNVKDHVVTLTGTVRSKNTKRAAWDAAWSVPGVADVNNNICVMGRRQRQAAQGEKPG